MARMRIVAVGIGTFLLFAAVGAAALLPVRQQTSRIDQSLITARVEAVEASASALRLMITSAKAQADSLGASLEPWIGSNRQAAEALPKINAAATQSGLFEAGIYISRPDGVVVATSNAAAALLSLRREHGFLEAARSATIFTPAFQDPLVKIPVVGVASPLRNSAGETTGVLIGMIPLKGPRFTALAESLPFAGDVQAFIVDPQGQVLELGRPEGVDRANKPALALKDRATSAASGSASIEGPGGIPSLGAWAMAGDGWLVVAHQAKSDLLRSAKGPLRTSALAVGILALVACLFILPLRARVKSARNEAERVKRAFLAIAGHELRTPLTSIRGFSQTLEGRWERITDEQRKQMLSTIARQARNLENLVERLLLGAQLEGGIKQSPMLREANVTEAIEKAVQHQRPQAPLHEFQIDSEPELAATVDIKGLNQVLTQLLENAIKYSPSGGTVYVKGRKVPGGVEVAVEDEGVGLPSDITGIFEKFGQAESVDTRVHDEGGMGLGLFIAKRHLEMMKGTIKAERREAGGARFVVRLRS